MRYLKPIIHVLHFLLPTAIDLIGERSKKKEQEAIIERQEMEIQRLENIIQQLSK